MEGFALQASFKTKQDTMINVRGEHPAEFDENLSHALSVVEQIHAAEAAFRGLSPQDLQQAEKLLETTLGAQKVAEYTTPPGATPPSGYQQTHCDRCKQVPVCPTCGQLCDVKPMSLKNGQYYKHPCKNCGRDGKTFWCNEPK